MEQGNCHKNYLPHHRAGSPKSGGDEYPDEAKNAYGKIRAIAVDRVRPLMKHRFLMPIMRGLRFVDVRTRPESMIRNGNWWGNDTIWRTILDINRILIYADAEGRIHDTPQRETYHVLDGIIAGEGDGPMAPERKDMGLIICSEDPVAADFVTAALMGFYPFKIPTIYRALEPHPLPLTKLGPRGEGLEIEMEGKKIKDWRDLPNYHFKPHPGWVGHIER